jgi:prepilin-type N-terminal cleavage/methylation domain-containing protein
MRDHLPDQGHRTALRSGFTAIELLVVIGVMLLLMSMALPGVLKVLRRAQVAGAAEAISSAWRQARDLAIRNPVPDAGPDGQRGAPAHYGIAIVVSGARRYVALIYSNRDGEAIARDPDGALMRTDPTDARSRPVLKQDFNGTVSVLAGTGGATPDARDRALAVYAQYRTGWPIAPAEVAANHGPVAAPTGIGLAGDQARGIPASPIASELRLQTIDYSAEAGHRRGYALDLTLYPIGVLGTKEL